MNITKKNEKWNPQIFKVSILNIMYIEKIDIKTIKNTSKNKSVLVGDWDI